MIIIFKLSEETEQSVVEVNCLNCIHITRICWWGLKSKLVFMHSLSFTHLHNMLHKCSNLLTFSARLDVICKPLHMIYSWEKKIICDEKIKEGRTLTNSMVSFVRRVAAKDVELLVAIQNDLYSLPKVTRTSQKRHKKCMGLTMVCYMTVQNVFLSA